MSILVPPRRRQRHTQGLGYGVSLPDADRVSLRRADYHPAAWDPLAARHDYLPGDFADPETYRRLAARIDAAAAAHGTGGNVLSYLATPPPLFVLIAEGLAAAGLHRGPGWRRLVVEKPFGKDLASAAELNRRILAGWAEDQVYRIDHYLGKETVQNLLVFRFANGMFEPLWNKTHVDHIQFTVSETVGVEGRGGYYDHAGVLRDMIENHMFRMLAYLCMEPPASFRPDAVRDEKAKLLNAVRVYGPAEVARNVVRGQYGPGKKPDGSPSAGYREESGVDPQSRTETFAALRLSCLPTAPQCCRCTPGVLTPFFVSLVSSMRPMLCGLAWSGAMRWCSRRRSASSSHV